MQWVAAIVDAWKGAPVRPIPLRPLERFFVRGVAVAVAIAASIRVVALVMADRSVVGGDGYAYHWEALRLADGLGYTSSVGDAGAPIAHHPPGWVTLLGVVSWLGGRSVLAHQLTATAIGLGVVAMAALVARRYFNARAGVIAALVAAAYPGFWLLERGILSEPLGLLLAGLLALLVADLRDVPTWRRSLAVGIAGGILALVRSEQLVLLPLVVAPVLLWQASAPVWRRLAYLVVVLLAAACVIAPWSIFISSKFRQPVLLSTNGGGTLLAGNCPLRTYGGERFGSFDALCELHLGMQHPEMDRSELGSLCTRTALDNMRRHAVRLPIVVVARIGRMLALFRPAETVRYAAEWMATGTLPIWAWVASYWLLLPLALEGLRRAIAAGTFVLPLLAPLLLTFAVVAVTFGEPRYHAPSDLAVVVLAAAALDAAVGRRFRRER